MQAAFRLCLLLPAITAFNVDVPSRVVHQAPTSTWFGYDVDIYKDATTAWAIIGAPKAQTSQPGVRKGGAVFRCSITESRCSEIEFDRTGHGKALNGSVLVQIDSKDEQFFGATVATSRSGDAVLACAPRYTYFYSRFDKQEPVGTCYLAREQFERITEFSPCRQEQMWGYHRLGFSMAGFSGAVSDTDETLFIGAPGSWYWQGSVVSQNAADADDRRRTEEGPADTDDTYLGYSTVAADFDGDGHDDAAVGVPKGHGLSGMVALYDANLRNLVNISGEQEGSYFGAAVSAGDVDGDGLDDLIVGAPFFVQYSSEKGVSQALYEVGKVYVYYQGADHAFSESTSVLGAREWSRFGYAVAGAGDLNGDGYGDVVVGAPYDGDDRRGAIFIFNGAGGGLRTDPSQVIFAKDVSPAALTTFGFSLAGGKDVDDNEYPDLIVGAYASDKAVVLRTRPVIKVTGAISMKPDVINLEDKICSIDGQFLPCSKARVCVEFDGKGAPSEIELNTVISLDAEKEFNQRVFFVSSPSLHRMTVPVSLQKGRSNCESYDFFVAPGISDKAAPIRISANFSLADASAAKAGELRPILDAQTQSTSAQIEIQKECGTDGTCTPDLQLSATLDKDRITVGGEDKALKLTVSVKNLNEDAFNAQFFLNMPAGLEYVGHKRLSKGVAVTCSAPTGSGGGSTAEYVFTCDIGNPLPRLAVVEFEFEFSTDGISPTAESIALEMSVNNTKLHPEAEATLEDNTVTLSLPTEVHAQLIITGASMPDQVNYDMDDRRDQLIFDSDVGPLVTHLYQVRNDGPSRLAGAVVDIYWPSYTQQRSHLLYLIDDPRVDGNAECRIQQQVNVNPDSLTVVQRVENDTAEMLHLRRVRRDAEPQAPDVGTPPSSATEVSRTLQRLVNAVKSYGQSMDYGGLNKLDVNCTEHNCTRIVCDIGALRKDEQVLIRVDARLWLNTLIDEAFYDASISSVAIARVNTPPVTGGVPLPAQTAVVSLFANPTDPTVVRRSVPFWLIFLAILAGITFLLLIILLLWKMGFFKRKRPPREHALLTKPTAGEHYGYSDYSTGYAPPALYSEAQHGPRL